MQTELKLDNMLWKPLKQTVILQIDHRGFGNFEKFSVLIREVTHSIPCSSDVSTSFLQRLQKDMASAFARALWVFGLRKVSRLPGLRNLEVSLTQISCMLDPIFKVPYSSLLM